MTTLLLAEHDNKSLKDSTNKALTAAKALGGDVHVLVAGSGAKAVADAAAKLEELSERYSEGHQYRLDGLSVEYEDWHFNVRPSNTEPLLRLCLESLVSTEDMERRRDEVLELIRS